MSHSHEIPDLPAIECILEIEEELRIHGSQGPCFKVALLSGRAVVFGSEMILSKEYTFPIVESISVFSWEGCKVRVVGHADCTVGKKTNTIIKVHLHTVLEERRIKAEVEDTRGPVVMVVGPPKVGKTTLCRVLLNYAAQMGRKPLFVDLDVKENCVSLPGTLGFLTVTKPEDIENGYDKEGAQVFPFGHCTLNSCILWYFLLVQRLGLKVKQILSSAPEPALRHSGVIINTGVVVRGHGYNAISLASFTFDVDIIYVINDEMLYLQLKGDMPPHVDVVFLPKMDGVIERSKGKQRKLVQSKMEEHFYGLRTSMPPFIYKVSINSVVIVRLTGFTVKENAHNFGIDLKQMKIKTLVDTKQLVNQVLAVSSAESFVKELAVAPIIGFVCLTEVDRYKNMYTFLSPQLGALKYKYLIAGSMQMTPRT